jgi:threonine dehydrogenase-like Zn-dependent dehydrogenase
MMRDLEVIGSVCPTGAWDAAVGLLAAGRVDTEALITHVLPLERFDEAYRLARGGPGVIKVVLEV